MEVSLTQALQQLSKANHIIITAHVHPDGDSLGSMLGLYHHLVASGKKVALWLDDTIPHLFGFLPGISDIHQITDMHLASDCELLVVLDTTAEADRIGDLLANLQVPILNIDHHLTNNRTADYWYIDSQASATGEIILQLLLLANTKITPEIATCLYTAIVTDCGFFRYANTSASTLSRAAHLVECGVQPNWIAEQLETLTVSDLTALTEVLNTLELSSDGRIASVTVSRETQAKSPGNSDSFINYARKIAGVEIAIMYKIADENTVRVSLRSQGVDVSKIAEFFGGGGHLRAAGCTVNGTLEIVKQQILTQAVVCLKVLSE